MNAVQYLTDAKGVKTSVVISIDDWKNLSNFMDEVKELEQIVKSVQSGLTQAKKIEAGELPTPSQTTEEFLNEL